MRAVVERVKEAKVSAQGNPLGEIQKGLLVFLGVMKGDNEADALELAQKVAELRVFEDEKGKMNLSLTEVGGSMLIVSQFTLAADCRKGRRPSFDPAADPETAQHLYDRFVEAIKNLSIPVATGEFRSLMEVQLINAGPVTLLLDSRKLF